MGFFFKGQFIAFDDGIGYQVLSDTGLAKRISRRKIGEKALP